MAASNDKRNRKRQKYAKALEEARAEHVEMLKKVVKARTKLERRSRKLQALETRMAELARRAYSPDDGRLGQAAAGADHLRSAYLIFNPDAGGNDGNGNKQLDKIVRRLRAHGLRAEIGLKTSGKAVRELAKELSSQGEEMIIVAAGDGTIEEVASQLVGTDVTLGIIPVGTMNNLARALGIPLDIDGACELLALNVTRKIDVGRVVANGKPEVEYFLETAGVGLSAIGIPAGQAAEKGKWSTLPSAIRRLFDSHPCPVEVELDGEQVVTANSELVTISNCPLLGNNIMLAPDAKMDDGLLDVAVYDNMGKTELLSYFVGSANGSRTYNPKIKFYRSKRAVVRSELAEDAHSDKDIIEGKQTLEIELLSQALSVVVGQGFALTLPVDAAPTPPPLTGKQQVAPSNGHVIEEKDRSPA
jgi:diacylglycerol kinase (ATP)